MIMKTVLGKVLSVGIIFLFIGATFTTVVESKNNDYVKLTVTEYKPDGTIESKIVEISHDNLKILRERLKNSKNLEERLSIYRSYGLIPQDVTCKKLKKDMELKAINLGLTEKKLDEIENKIKLKLPNGDSRVYFLNRRCTVQIGGAVSLFTFIGLSSLISRINFYLKLEPDNRIPSFDLLNFGYSSLGLYNIKDGVYPDIEEDRLLSMTYLVIGFVGYSVAGLEFFSGFARFVGLEGYALFAYGSGISL